MKGKIKNFDDLAVTEERTIALRIAEAGLAAIDTDTVVKKWIRKEEKVLYVGEEGIRLDRYKRLFVVGVGKCALKAGSVLEEILGDTITGGIVLDVHEGHLSRIKTYVGTHPYPSRENMVATAEIISFLAGLSEKDLVIFAISGGGSTLLCQPRNLEYAVEAELLKILFREGAAIDEINVLRKHLSLARGGYLAACAYPARVISLIFSDVPGDDMQYIASGPTVMDTTTIDDAEKIIIKYDLEKRTELKIELTETPKDPKYFRNVKNIIVVSNTIALHAMEEEAKQSGFSPVIVTSALQGEAREVGVQVVQKLHTASPKTAMLYGGETTVTIRGDGKGGRNQEVALGALGELRSGELIVSLASDGKDDSDYAGALCDTITKEKVEEMKLDSKQFLERNDSYHFFEQIGDMLSTGDTGSNVSDLIIALKQ